MTLPPTTPTATPRTPVSAADYITSMSRAAVWLLLICSVMTVAIRIVHCQSSDPNRPVPFLSANDRSRWCTIRALVDDGTYAIDDVIEGSNGNWWDTIDKVRHADENGQMRYYSSKPPIWPTFLAGQYWLLREATGLTLQKDTFAVVRILLLVNNAIALGLFIWFMGRVAERMSDLLWTRLFIIATAAFGTSLTTFSVTLNNHLPSAVMTAGSLWILIRIWRGSSGRSLFFALGLFAALAAALELPATLWLVICLGCALLRSPGRTLLLSVPAVLLVGAAFFGTNYLAHGTWKLAYANRQDGPVVTSVSGDWDATLDQGELPAEIADKIQSQESVLGFQLSAVPSVTVVDGIDAVAVQQQRRWIINRDQANQLVIVRNLSGQEYEIRRWGNWYDYPGSYWSVDNNKKSLVDQGERDPTKYLLHTTIGHHGVLSLTPVFLISVLGLFPLLALRDFRFRWLALVTAGITVGVFYFYLSRDALDRNYGGVTSSLRWVMWLYPIWLAWMTPVLDGGRGRIRRGLILLLLAISVASAAYAADNPWSHPWLYQWMEWRGIIASTVG